VDTNLENTLKEAYFLEMRGKSLYQESIREGMSEELKGLFGFFAKEEEGHAAFIKEQLRLLKAGNSLSLPERKDNLNNYGFPLKKIASAIEAAGYEGALVGAALDFERRACEFYSEQVEKSEDTGLKALFAWLADWERQHMILFSELDKEIREQVWYDNSFWPLD